MALSLPVYPGMQGFLTRNATSQLPVYVLDLGDKVRDSFFAGIVADHQPAIMVLFPFVGEAITGSKDRQAQLVLCNTTCKNLSLGHPSAYEKTIFHFVIEPGDELTDGCLGGMVEPSNTTKCEILPHIKAAKLHIRLHKSSEYAASQAERTEVTIRALNFCRDLDRFVIRYHFVGEQGDMAPTAEKLKLCQWPWRIAIQCSLDPSPHNQTVKDELRAAWEQSPQRAANKARREALEGGSPEEEMERASGS